MMPATPTPFEVVARGGCYWPNTSRSPGHSLVLETGTSFRNALEGPKSHVWVSGRCDDGFFILGDGSRFDSANEAVNAVREPSTNAFLYIEFATDVGWVSADRLREWEATDPGSGFDDAMKMAKEVVRDAARKQKRNLDNAYITRRAAQLVVERWDAFSNAFGLARPSA